MPSISSRAFELGDHGEEFAGGDGLGRGQQFGVDAELAAGFDLAADVDFAGCDRADEDDGESRLRSLGGERGDLGCDFAFDFGGNGDAVQYLRIRHTLILSTLGYACSRAACPAPPFACLPGLLRGVVAGQGEWIDCTGCGRRYPIVDSLPVLIASRAVLPEEG